MHIVVMAIISPSIRAGTIVYLLLLDNVKFKAQPSSIMLSSLVEQPA